MSAAGGLISLLVGTALLRLVVTGTYGRYVRVGMGPWLAIAGVAVIVLGLVTLVREARRGERGAPEGSGEPRAGAPVAPLDGHDHGGGNRMGWLLLAPIAALLLVAPPTLGSFGVDRGTQVNVRAGGAVLAPLRPGPKPIAMTLLEYQIACCAADAAPVVLRVVGVRSVPARDQWVRITGSFHPGDGEIPELAASNVVEIRAPEDPYE